LENVEKSYAQALQDMFVLVALQGKKNGVYLDIGAFDPIFISNTYLLDRAFGWSGIAVDITPDCAGKFQRAGRNCRFIQADATKLDYVTLLANYSRIDYLSLDIEPNIHTLECLRALPLDTCRFSVITFETDVYDPQPDSEYVRRESRELLKKKGYILVNGNVSNLDDEHPFEDWYLDPMVISSTIIDQLLRAEDTPLAAHKYLLLS
jgi:hypothetical protein